MGIFGIAPAGGGGGGEDAVTAHEAAHNAHAAGDLTYTPDDASQWTDPDPASVNAALEALVARVAALEAAGSGGYETGDIRIYAKDTLPDGWLWCDGSAVSRSTYSDLFGAVGEAFGAGDGSTTFNLPDMRGRTPIGLDNMGGTSANRVTDTNADSIGGAGGAETHTLTESELASHVHQQKRDTGAGGGGNLRPWETGTVLGFPTESAGGDGAHNNMPPWVAINYIIKT